MMTLAALASAVVLTWLWRRSREFRREDSEADTGAFYVMLAAGAYFAGHLVLGGSL